MNKQQADELINNLYAVEAEMAYVEALLRMHLRRAESRGDEHIVERIRSLIA
jgi:hypothetical protein